MNTTGRILKNVLSNWAGYLISIIIAFFLSPFIVHSLGNTGYGIWVLVGSLTGYLGILDFGIRPAIVKFVSRNYELKDDDEVNRVINTSLVIFTIIAVVIVICSVILAFLASELFNSPEEFRDEFSATIILIGITVALGFPFGVFNALINALQRFDLNNLITISALIIRAVLIVVFLNLGGGLIALAVIVLATSLLEFVFKAYAGKKIFPSLRIGFSLAGKDTLKILWGFSVFTFLINIAYQISYYTDSVVIGAFMTTGAITFFAIGGSLIEYLKQLINHISVTVTPVASGLEAVKDFEKMKKLLLTGTKYCLVVIFPVGLTYIVLGDIFIGLWMGPEYAEDSSKVLIILMISYFGYLSQLVSISIFYGLGKIKRLSFLILGASLANIIISVLLVRSYGIFGVAWGTTVPQLVLGSFILPLYICKTLKLKLFTYIRYSFVPPVLSAIPFVLILYYSRTIFDINSFPRFGLVLFPSCVIYSVISYFVSLDKDHKFIVRQKISDIFGVKNTNSRTR